MGASNRSLALLDIVSVMSTITTSNGYANTIAEVYLHAIDWHTARVDGPLPCIGVLPLACAWEHISPFQMRGRQEVAIEFGYAASTDAEVWSRGDSLVDDIIAALMVDRTRGGNALGTEITSAETEQGNPDTMDSQGGTAAGIVRCTLIMQRQLGVS